MNNSIFRGRLRGYTPAGFPVMERMVEPQCSDYFSTDVPVAGRHIGYTPDGIPRAAFTYTCCNLVDHNCKVQNNCLAPQTAGGVRQTMLLYVYDVNNCASAAQRVIATYSGPACGTGGCGPFGGNGATGCADTGGGCGTPCCGGKWSASIALRGGTLAVEICGWQYVDVDLTVKTRWRLHWSACSGVGGTDAEGCFDQDAVCYDPLHVSWPTIALPHCCSCIDSTQTGQISITAVSNCREVFWGRHIGYTPAGIPVMAMADPCNPLRPIGCLTALCGLHMSVTGDSACACLLGSYSMPYGEGTHGAGYWEQMIGSCLAGITADVFMHCDDAGVDSQGRPLIRLTLTLTCGATNVGGPASVVILASDFDTLDVTFFLSLSDPGPPACTGVCSWTYVAMAFMWVATGNTCAGTCNSCPATPTSPPASPVDGQTYSEACPATAYTVPCCIGNIAIRVTR